MRKTSELPPGPRMPAALQTLGFWSRPTAFLERARQRYGRRFTIRLLGSPPFVMLSDPDEIKQIFQAPPEVLHPGEGARILEPVLGRHSVILLDEDPHLEQRKLMLPAFHGERMARLSGLIDELARAEVASWPREQAVALHARLQGLTLEIILRAVFGLERGAQLDQLRELLTRLLAFAESPLSLLPPVPPALARHEPIARLTPTASLERVDELIFELIDERRRDGGGGEDVLTMLLEAEHADGSPMSNQELRDELLTALVAGHETTASQLAWTFERLSREPAVLDRLYAELDNGDDETYLTATINEIMRHRPVLPNPEPRLVKQRVQIGDFVYPPGVALVASAYLLHHDPAIYPEPYALAPRALLGAVSRHLYLDSVRRRPPALPGCQLRAPGDEAGPARRARELRAAPGRGQPPEATRRRSITISPARGSRVVLGDRRRTADTPPAPAPALVA